jgi:transmembrane protein TMEM174 (potassium channel)
MSAAGTASRGLFRVGEMPTGPIEFSDGAFAIVMTILVLEIHVRR